MPKWLDPELVHSLYLNCKKDQLVIYIDEDRACHAIRRSAMLHLPSCVLFWSIELIGFEARGDHQCRAKIVWQLVQDSRRQVVPCDPPLGNAAPAEILRREDPTNAGQKLFGNSREIPGLQRFFLLLLPRKNHKISIMCLLQFSACLSV
uniref:Uncharacterized protein n=1 Tax=Oryza barthii TaxID=65489 RepID=A0A0D3GDA1_9ORYZ